MLIGALGCNLAWGIIDGGVYLMARLDQSGRAIVRWRAVRDTKDALQAQQIIADALSPLLTSVLAPAQLELIRQKLLQSAAPPPPQLVKDDWLGALGICLLSFLSTFPVVVPFLMIAEARLALRVSNVIAIAMLFLCGFMFGRYAGFRPTATGLAMVGLGSALAAVAIALGG
jgi:VIT1/CCC1 family predicted Fe2+/Mn2+ transporter